MLALAFVFFFGVFNFAAHKAVLESRHPLLAQIPLLSRLAGGRLSLVLEFAVLLLTMTVVAAGSVGWAWLYALYTAVNVAAAWVLARGKP